jgi:hypothetical protein
VGISLVALFVEFEESGEDFGAEIVGPAELVRIAQRLRALSCGLGVTSFAFFTGN